MRYGPGAQLQGLQGHTVDLVRSVESLDHQLFGRLMTSQQGMSMGLSKRERKKEQHRGALGGGVVQVLLVGVLLDLHQL